MGFIPSLVESEGTCAQQEDASQQGSRCYNNRHPSVVRNFWNNLLVYDQKTLSSGKQSVGDYRQSALALGERSEPLPASLYCFRDINCSVFQLVRIFGL